MWTLVEDVTIMLLSVVEGVIMSTSTQGAWASLSAQIADTVTAVENSIVTVHGGGRSTSSGVIWRPGVVVTVRQGLRRADALQVAQHGDPTPATLAGIDAGTDLAVLRVGAQMGAPAEKASGNLRVGEVVLGMGRSRLGDISASAGIVARLGAGWRTWRGGQIDSLIRPDLELYVGQTGSALVKEGGGVLGINSAALANHAVITIPAITIDRVVDAILERGHVPRPFLGAAMQAVPVPATLRAQFPEGAEEVLLVLHVEPQGAAGAAGMQVGDLIHSVDGRPAHAVQEVQHLLLSKKVGDTLPVGLLRGGVRTEISVLLADRG
jgi:S1-C subfamily serine protease